MTVADHWPLFRLRIRTPWLELRFPDDHDLLELARLAGDGFDVAGEPQWMQGDWVRLEPRLRMRSVLQWNWRARAAWRPDDWHLELVVVEAGTIVGTQAAKGVGFGVTGLVTTGSWLGSDHRGRGIGTEMRAAILHLAFAELGATSAESSAWLDNARSIGVSRKLGYRDNGVARLPRGDGADYQQRLVLDRQDWEAHRRADIVVDGLDDACLAMFGGTNTA